MQIFHVLDQKQRGFVSKVELSHILDAMQVAAPRERVRGSAAHVGFKVKHPEVGEERTKTKTQLGDTSRLDPGPNSFTRLDPCINRRVGRSDEPDRPRLCSEADAGGGRLPIPEARGRGGGALGGDSHALYYYSWWMNRYERGIPGIPNLSKGTTHWFLAPGTSGTDPVPPRSARQGLSPRKIQRDCRVNLLGSRDGEKRRGWRDEVVETERVRGGSGFNHTLYY